MKKIFRTISLFCVAIIILMSSVTASAESPLRTEYLFTANITFDDAMNVNESKYGYKSIYTITGGTVKGEKISGTILSGGVDWQLLRRDGDTEHASRYTLRTDDGVLIKFFADCLVDSTQLYKRCVPEFEAPWGKYYWLNNSIFVGKLSPGYDANSASIAVYRLK